MPAAPTPPGPDPSDPAPAGPDRADPTGAVDACRRSHQRLWATVAGLDDEAVRRPSLLPDWSVAHVLTHLARNADAFTRLLTAAEAGQQADMYSGGPEGRARDIEEGAARPAAAILQDLAQSTAALEAAMDGATEAAWAGFGRGTYGARIPCRLVPARRRREVEVHHVDLGLGYGPDDWPADFVDDELPQAIAGLADRLTVGPERSAVLAWLQGRAPAPAPGQLTLGPWEPAPPPPPGR